MDAEWIHVMISMVTVVLVPLAAFYVKAEISKPVSALRLEISQDLANRRVHERESELRHESTNARIVFLEGQWQAVQNRLDQQQNAISQQPPCRNWSPKHGD